MKKTLNFIQRLECTLLDQLKVLRTSEEKKSNGFWTAGSSVPAVAVLELWKELNDRNYQKKACQKNLFRKNIKTWIRCIRWIRSISIS